LDNNVPSPLALLDYNQLPPQPPKHQISIKLQKPLPKLKVGSRKDIQDTSFKK